MRSKSPEMRGRQKVVRPPIYKNENEYNPEATPQYFQVVINILEGKNLAWINPQYGNSYVVVALGKTKYSTTIRRNMLEPHYKESFVFDMYDATIYDIRQTTLRLAVMEPKCCAPARTLGEVSIDLGTIWAQPDHQICHKWAQLNLPRNSTAGPVGFIKLDISIKSRSQVLAEPFLKKDNIKEGRFLLPVSSEQQCAKYVITVFGVFGLPNGGNTDKRLGKPPSTFIKVSFSEMTAKTRVKHCTKNPMFCEQISMIEMFPNICQIIDFEVYTIAGSFNRVLTKTHLNLAQISHQGENGFLPTFGPSLLHMYGIRPSDSGNINYEDDPNYCGALLVMLKTIVPYYELDIGRVIVEPVPPIPVENLWVVEDFCLFCPILEVSMLNQSIAGNFCGIAITIGEFCDNNIGDEFLDLINETRSRKLHYTGNLEVTNESEYGFIDFMNAFPVLQFAIRLPDFRSKVYRNNIIQTIVNNLELVTCEIENRLKYFEYNNINDLMNQLNVALDDASESMLKFIAFLKSSIKNYENIMSQFRTELDLKQLTMQIEETGKLHKRTSARKVPKEIDTVSRKSVKLLLADTQNLIQDLKFLIYKVILFPTQYIHIIIAWPAINITVWLLNGGSRVAFSKICPSDVIYSTISEQCSKNCGRIQTVYMKPLKCSKHHTLSSCYCIVGKVELLLWMSLYQQHSDFLHRLSNFLPGYKLKTKDYALHVKCSSMVIEYRAFIYKAKFNNILKGLSSLQLFVRITLMNNTKDTKVKCKTFTPIWNEVLKIRRMVYMTPGRLIISPPIVFVEVYNTILSGKYELLGSCQVTPMINENYDYEYAPTLQWYALHRGVECTGQVLMSVQIIQIPEKLLKNTVYSPVTERVTSEISKETNCFDDFKPLPSNLIPSSSYKVDIYWWGLRDVSVSQKPGAILEIEDLSIRSDIIHDKRLNSNFPNGKTSATLEAHLNGSQCSELSIRLFDSGTFGRTLDLGINVMKNPNKYIVNWWPKNQRDASLKRASITSADFAQISPSFFIKRSSELLRSVNYGSTVSKKSLVSKLRAKRIKWRNLFWRRELHEEECTLLPIFSKKDNKPMANSPNVEQKDWWQNYLISQKDCYYENHNGGDKLTIYDTELESQPEFSKFRDWCKAFKLYNGKKTGIPGLDEQIYCGLLKTGIAIYKWPPPENVIPVNSSGMDLNKGYFDDHPNNDPLKFLIRVYIVKGLKLRTKGFVGKCNPYIILKCGNKCLGDRNHYISNTFNPIFGKMYEFHCCLPSDYLLEISIYDYGAPDEIIGFTSIDLEDRIYTKHLARVGLSNEYSKNDILKWRDCVKPSDIMDELCAKNHLPSPMYSNNSTIIINDVAYKHNEQALERKENLCLSILHKWHTLPVCGHHLVPEHVETRMLYNSERPGLEQGKLELWVDIFPLNTNVYIPPPIDITPRKVEDYELRVTIHCLRDLVNVRSSKKKSDVHIRAWLACNEEAQNTNVHYDCERDAHFNWQMVFKFQYHPTIRKVICKEKGIFTEFEEYVSPVLVVQLMDCETTSPNDCLGSLELNLNAMPQGFDRVQQCTLGVMNPDRSLFSSRTLSSWWPLIVESSETLITGKIYMDLNLLSQEQAMLMPVVSPFVSPKLQNPYNGTNCFYNIVYIIKNLNETFKTKNSSVLVVCILIAFIVLLVIYFELPMIILHYYYCM